MIAFEVSLNGKRVCVAGAEDLSVLSAIVTASGKLGKKTAAESVGNSEGWIYFSVGGLTGRKDSGKDVHVSWKSVEPLKVGDVIEVKVLERRQVDRPKSRMKVDGKRAEARRKKLMRVK